MFTQKQRKRTLKTKQKEEVSRTFSGKLQDFKCTWTQQTNSKAAHPTRVPLGYVLNIITGS